MKELDGLNDDFVAWGQAAIDKEFTLFKIYTRPLRGTDGHDGQYTADCRYELARFELYNDQVGFLKYLCRMYLLHMKKETGVPFENWIIEFSPTLERLQIPSHLYLDTARDRAWLL